MTNVTKHNGRTATLERRREQQKQLDGVLRELKAEHGRVLSTPVVAAAVRQRMGVEVTALYRVFGSLEAALRRVGAVPSRVHRVKREPRYEDMARRMAARLGHAPTVQEWDAHRPAGAPGARPISRAYGGWPAFLEAAGLEPRSSQLRRPRMEFQASP